MSRARRFASGVTLGYFNLTLVTVVGLWLTPFLLGHVGQAQLGLWLVATQLLGYLGLLDVGVLALLPREVAYALGRGSEVELVAVVHRVRGIVRYQALLVAACAVAVWLLLPSAWEPLRVPLAVVLAVYTLTYPVRLYQGVLQGLQELTFLGQLQTAVWTTSTIVTVSLVLAGYGFTALIAGWFVLHVGTLGGCALRVRSRHRALWSSGRSRRAWHDARVYLAQSAWISVAQLAQVFLGGTDLLIVGQMLGPAAVVPYACTGKLIAVFSNHPQMLMQAAAPALSELRAAQEQERLRVLSVALGRAMLLASGAVACVVIVANQPFVSWWVGADQFGGRTLTLILAGGMLLRHWNTTLAYALFCFGQERRLSVTTLADGAVSIVAAVLLVPWLGPPGAALGLACGALAISAPANHRALGRALGCSPWQLLRVQLPVIVRLVALLAVSAWAAGQMRLGIPWVIGAGAATGGVYLLVMASFAFSPPLLEFTRRFTGRRLVETRDAVTT